MKRTSDTWVRLSAVEPGQTAVIRRFEGGQGVAHRLASIGLLPGATVRMMRCIGPVILESRNNRVILGRGMVRHIWVEPCPATNAEPPVPAGTGGLEESGHA